MMKPKYILLVLSLIELTIGLSNARQNIFFYLGLPVGAALFGLFLIAQVLEKESALYDEQSRASVPVQKSSDLANQPLSIQPEVTRDPSLAPAHSH